MLGGRKILVVGSMRDGCGRRDKLPNLACSYAYISNSTVTTSLQYGCKYRTARYVRAAAFPVALVAIFMKVGQQVWEQQNPEGGRQKAFSCYYSRSTTCYWWRLPMAN